MRKFTISSGMTHYAKMFVRNSMLSLYATLSLFILYLSVYQDERAAVLCYATVALTVLTMKYAIRDGSTGAYTAYFINVLSKIMIFTGISLAIFPKFWDTAFYSICLGILAQKMKCEMELREGSVSFYLNAQILGDDTKMNSFHEFKPIIHEKQSIRLHEVAQNAMQTEENKLKDLNEDQYSSNIIKSEKVDLFRRTPEKLSKTKGFGKVESETASSHKYLTEISLDLCDIKNEERVTSSNLNLNESLAHANKNENILHNKNMKKENDTFTDKDASVLKHFGTLFESQSVPNYIGIEGKNSEVINVRKMLQTELFTIESDAANISHELEQNEDTLGKCTVLNDEAIREDTFLSNDTEQLDSIQNRIESTNGSKSNEKNRLLNVLLIVNSHVYQNNSETNSSSSFEYKNLSCKQDYREAKDEFDLKTENSSQCNENSLLFDDEFLDLNKTSFQNERCSDETNSSRSKANAENNFINDIVLAKNNSCIAGQNLNSEIKHESKNCQFVTNTDIKLEKEMSTVRRNYEQIYINDDNLKTNAGKVYLKEPPNSEMLLESKAVLNSCMIFNCKEDSSKRNESKSNSAEKNETNELAANVSRNVTETSSVSDVEDAVNRIDLGFIYTLGYNVPCMTDSF